MPFTYIFFCNINSIDFICKSINSLESISNIIGISSSKENDNFFILILQKNFPLLDLENS